MKLTESNIQFNVCGNMVRFKIYHDMPDTPGLTIEDALNNWILRTDNFTAKSLVKYIKSKGVSTAMTESTYNKRFKNDPNS